MENINTIMINHPKITIKNGMVEKYSSKTVEGWEKLLSKGLDFLILPVSMRELTAEEKRLHPYCNSWIKLIFYDEYLTFRDKVFGYDFKTKDLLLLFQEHLSLLRQAHQNDVIIVDLNAENMLINAKNDIKFIDMDAALVDGDTKNAELCPEEYQGIELLKQHLISEDKRTLLSIYFNYLLYGNFKNQIEIQSLNGFMPPNTDVETLLLSYFDSQGLIDSNDYFDDLINKLIKLDYNSVAISARKILRKYKIGD